MLNNWLQPIAASVFENLNLSKRQLGKKMRCYTTELPDLNRVKIALIGVEEASANAVRRALYPCSYPFPRLKIADLGNLRKPDPSFIIPLFKELLDSKITPILIGENSELSLVQYQAHQLIQQNVNFAIIDESIPYHPKENEAAGYYLNPILQKGSTDLFHFSVVGCQSHFLDDLTLMDLEQRHLDYFQLGQVRAQLPEIEPVIRDADFVSFHLAALRQSDAPAQKNASPSGFFTEEACQISRYAGMNDKLTSVGFYGFLQNLDRSNQTAQVVAQLIWYFLDGFYHRKNDYPASMNSLVEYIVNFKAADYQLTFWKSNKSGRWWLQVPVKTDRKHRRHRLIPCSYQDYMKASQGELAERLAKGLERF